MTFFCTVYTLGFQVGKNRENYHRKQNVKQNVGQSRIDNPFILIKRFSSKRHSSFLNYHMKLSHCHVHVTATIVGADLRTCQTSIMKFFAKRKSIVLNTPLHCDE